MSRKAEYGATPTYLVYTKSYGILRKAEDNIAAARAWAKRAFGAEVRSVHRERRGTSIEALEAAQADWDRTVSR